VRAVRGGRLFIWEMDVYPDIAVELGVLRPGAWVTRGLGWALDAVRRRADGVIVLGESMRERLLGHGIPAERLFVAENWADGGEIRPRAFPSRQRPEVLYSGNLGLAHDVETLCGGLEALAGDPRFRFTFAGGGPQRAALERFCGGMGFPREEKASGGREAALPIWRSAVPGRAERVGGPAEADRGRGRPAGPPDNGAEADRGVGRGPGGPPDNGAEPDLGVRRRPGGPPHNGAEPDLGVRRRPGGPPHRECSELKAVIGSKPKTCIH
jgi:hypothetical protein